MANTIKLKQNGYKRGRKIEKNTGRTKKRGRKRRRFLKIRLINSIENAVYAKLNSTTHYCHSDFNGKLSHLISSVILFTLQMSAYARRFYWCVIFIKEHIFEHILRSVECFDARIFVDFHNFQFHYALICFVTHSFLDPNETHTK